MGMSTLRFARTVLAVLAGLGALSGAVLTVQAYELLVDGLRLNAALVLGLCSATLFIASGWLVLGRRGALHLVSASAAAMIMAVVLGLFYMGEGTVHEAF
ncbi:hypothetical protein [Massilia consociata]|uniref:Uncharacterized protein n=1 Tax=Massilia consociata TaxID=760117 RepID=A0ABV6FAM1_9BURK